MFPFAYAYLNAHMHVGQPKLVRRRGRGCPSALSETCGGGCASCA